MSQLYDGSRDQEEQCGYDNNDTSWPIQDGSNAADESVSAASCRQMKYRKQKKKELNNGKK